MSTIFPTAVPGFRSSRCFGWHCRRPGAGCRARGVGPRGPHHHGRDRAQHGSRHPEGKRRCGAWPAYPRRRQRRGRAQSQGREDRGRRRTRSYRDAGFHRRAQSPARRGGRDLGECRPAAYRRRAGGACRPGEKDAAGPVGAGLDVRRHPPRGRPATYPTRPRCRGARSPGVRLPSRRAHGRGQHGGARTRRHFRGNAGPRRRALFPRRRRTHRQDRGARGIPALPGGRRVAADGSRRAATLRDARFAAHGGRGAHLDDRRFWRSRRLHRLPGRAGRRRDALPPVVHAGRDERGVRGPEAGARGLRLRRRHAAHRCGEVRRRRFGLGTDHEPQHTVYRPAGRLRHPHDDPGGNRRGGRRRRGARFPHRHPRERRRGDRPRAERLRTGAEGLARARTRAFASSTVRSSMPRGSRASRPRASCRRRSIPTRTTTETSGSSTART